MAALKTELNSLAEACLEDLSHRIENRRILSGWPWTRPLATSVLAKHSIRICSLLYWFLPISSEFRRPTLRKFSDCYCGYVEKSAGANNSFTSCWHTCKGKAGEPNTRMGPSRSTHAEVSRGIQAIFMVVGNSPARNKPRWSRFEQSGGLASPFCVLYHFSLPLARGKYLGRELERLHNGHGYFGNYVPRGCVTWLEILVCSSC